MFESQLITLRTGDHILCPVDRVMVYKDNIFRGEDLIIRRFMPSYNDDRQCYVFRANLEHTMLVANPKHGIVCFCHHYIPEGWTHFLIVKVAKSGKWCECIPMEASMEWLYEQYKRCMLVYQGEC